MLSVAVEPSTGSISGVGTEAPMCDVSLWPQVLHFIPFDFLATKSVQAHVALSFEDPVQAMRSTERWMRFRNVT